MVRAWVTWMISSSTDLHTLHEYLLVAIIPHNSEIFLTFFLEEQCYVTSYGGGNQVVDLFY